MADSRRKARLRALERLLELVPLNYTRNTRSARAEAPLPLSNISLRRYCIESGSLPAENDLGSPCYQDSEPTSMVFLLKMDSDSGQRAISAIMRSIRSFICSLIELLHIRSTTRLNQMGPIWTRVLVRVANSGFVGRSYLEASSPGSALKRRLQRVPSSKRVLFLVQV